MRIGYLIMIVGLLGILYYLLVRPVLMAGSLTGASAVQMTQYYSDGTFHVVAFIGVMLFGGLSLLVDQSKSE